MCEGKGQGEAEWKWRCHASLLGDKKTFMVKTMNNVHICMRSTKNRNVTAKWIAGKLKDKLRVDENISYELMSEELVNRHGVNAKKWKLYRAKLNAREDNAETHADSYKNCHDIPSF